MGEKITIWILDRDGACREKESNHEWGGKAAAVDNYVIRLTDAYHEERRSYLYRSDELPVRDTTIPSPNIRWIVVEGTMRDFFQESSASETSNSSPAAEIIHA